MIEIERVGRVDAPVADVWKVVSDARRAPDWFSFADRTDVVSGSGLGERRTQHGRWGGKRSEIDQEVIEFVPDKVIAWKHTAERLDGKPAPVFSSSSVFRIELEAHDGHTVVRLRTQQLPRDGLRKIAMKLFGTRDITRRMEDSLHRLPGAVDGS
ncbi:SRPBCC family protein [Actinokineospora sp. HUAS TT18]|uniref:SRPBCC family protein n=1 Tax=Actinokineospora sp. HUAS TT18 TaxID=3447451 RepID=UPI003F524C1A